MELLIASGCSKPSEPQPSSAAVEKSTAEKAAAKLAADKSVADLSAAEKPTARQILERMVATYRNASSYYDQGVWYFDALVDGQRIGNADEPRPFSVAMVRPDKAGATTTSPPSAKFHVEAFFSDDTAVICDGKDYWAFTQSVPDQIVKTKAPAEVNMDSIFSDPLLRFIRSKSIVGDLPQLVLLTSKDPLASLLAQGEEPTLLEPEKWQGRLCQRVSIRRPDGALVLWIDAETNILLRIDYPIDGTRMDWAQQGKKVESVRLTAEFRDAKIGSQIDPGLFRVEVPASTESVTAFRPAHPGSLLRKPVPDFEVQDLNGKAVNPKTIKNKATVIQFWSTTSDACRQALPILQKFADKYRTNRDVAFWAVNVDDKSVDNMKLINWMRDIKVTIPVARDPESRAAKLFKIQAIPATYVIGPDGLVQDYLFESQPEVVEEFVKRLEKLLAGATLYDEKLADYEEWQKQVAAAKPTEQIGQLPEQQNIPVAEIAPASKPQTLKLKSLWKCNKLKDPGNILVIQEKDKTQIFVCDAWVSVAELSLDGQIVATHSPSLPKGEGFSSLRTAVGKDGKRYCVASARGSQQVHLFDDAWKTVINFPEDALENRHAGMGDAILADLDDDGTLEMYVGYLGVVGVQGVDLTGKRLWANRTISPVLGLAPFTDSAGHHNLLCTAGGDLVLLNAKGEKQDQIPVGRRELHAVVVANLEQGSPAKICVLAAADLGVYSLVGVDPQKKDIWNYDLPKGVYGRPVEPIMAGQVLSSLDKHGPGQWLAAAADGSIHILDAQGKLLDRFCYGSRLAGLATAEINGRPTLLISSTEGVEALQIEP